MFATSNIKLKGIVFVKLMEIKFAIFRRFFDLFFNDFFLCFIFLYYVLCYTNSEGFDENVHLCSLISVLSLVHKICFLFDLIFFVPSTIFLL